MDEVGKTRQVDPKWALVGIVLVGVLGAAVVFVSASVLHARDRTSLATWEKTALPLIDKARRIHSQMEQTERSLRRLDRPAGGGRFAARVQSYRTDTQRIIRALEEMETPDILENVAVATFTGCRQTLEAITALERELASIPVSSAEHAAFLSPWKEAGRRFAVGETLLIRLRCRARVNNCGTLPSPAVSA